MSSPLARSLRFLRAYVRWALLGALSIFAATAFDLIAPQLLRSLIDRGVVGGQPTVILRDAVLLIAVASAGSLASFFQGYCAARASHGVAFDLRNHIFDKLQRLSFSYHDRAQSGQLITRVTSDVDQVREFVGGGLVQVVSAAVLLVGAAFFLLSLDATLAVIALVVLPVTLGVLFAFVRRLGPVFRESQARLAALNTVLQENVAGARVVRAFAREPLEAERYERANRLLLEQGLVVRRTVANAFPLLFSVGTIGVGLVTWAGAVQIVQGTLTVGELVAFTSYLFLLLQPLIVIGFGATQIARAAASAERLFEIIDAPEEVAERPGARELGRLDGRIEFEGVCLRYPGEDSDTLSDIDLTLSPDTTVAIVGATGSGKTSLVNLVPRFYEAQSGTVRVDGHDVRDVTLSSLRGQIGFVMQDPVLFSGTIRDNIAYGRPEATMDEVEGAALAAQAHDFVLNLPHGYDTVVGERGVRLSGGQRQRIAIARALLIQPRILIMDDSTSSVDSATEAAIRHQLEALMRGRTTLVVAQRLATARQADLVVVMDAGRIADVGTHEDLLGRSCLYAEIAASQLVGGEALELPASCPLDPASADAGGEA